MKLIVTEKEIAKFLVSLIDHRSACKDVEFTDSYLAEALGWSLEKKGRNKFLPKKYVPKAREKIADGISKDFHNWIEKVESVIQNRTAIYQRHIQRNIRYYIENLGIENIFEAYRNSKYCDFVKGTGLNIDKDSEFVRRIDYTNYTEDCLFRNMEGNETLILDKINNNLPFWFIDTGYTNFLNGKKKTWHRLVRNNLHHSKMFEVPVDRLNNFESFPLPWRGDGEKILLIEPGQFSAKTFNVDIKEWTNRTIKEIRKYTDKKIVIREKLSKKVRKNLHRELLDEDYHCIVNINSNASVEAIWAGIPAITLHTHISNSVTRNKISDINNLFKGNIANWIAYLSYCQFTEEELTSGKAYKLMEKYHV